jgi:hypothetical protein
MAVSTVGLVGGLAGGFCQAMSALKRERVEQSWNAFQARRLMNAE